MPPPHLQANGVLPANGGGVQRGNGSLRAALGPDRPLGPALAHLEGIPLVDGVQSTSLASTTSALASRFVALKRAASLGQADGSGGAGAAAPTAAETDADLFESEFLRVLARVHGAIER